ncbi:MAG: TolC family protein [Deltaproteobacteria bacterium]|nr:TolC family protein [Deltaproteobacteria bacterium]
MWVLKKTSTILISVALMFSWLLATPLSAAEAETEVLTLSGSISMALEKSLSLDSADKAIEKAEWEKKKAFKGFLPTVSGAYSYTRLDEAPSSSVVTYGAFNNGAGVGSLFPLVPTGTRHVTVGTEDNYQAKLTLAQPIFTGFKLKSTYDLAKLGIDTAKVDKEREILDVILKAKESYFGILQAEKALQVADQAVKQFEAHLNVARNFYNEGMSTKNQVLEAEVNLAEAVQTRIKAENALLLARAGFNNLLRRPIDAPIRVEDILAYKPFVHDLQYCLDQALRLRPEIKAILLKIDMANEQVHLSRAGYFPAVALAANQTWKGDSYQVRGSSYMDDYDSWDVTVGMTWEFWNWLKTRDAVKGSKASRDIAHNGLTQIRDGIRLEVNHFFLSLKEAEKQIFVAEKAIARAEENYRMSEERYRVQIGTSTEVIDAATLLTSARRRYYDALYSYNLAWADLERGMGFGRDGI